MEQKIKISTIIPVYNAEKYLVRCLDSIIKQPLEEKEIICVNDGSTDSSLEILQNYERKFPRIIKVINQKNQYSGAAKNRGLSLAKGEYIHFVDADDYLYDNVYPELYKCAKNLGADYVKGRGLTFDLHTGKDYKSGKFSLINIKSEIFGKLISTTDYPEELIISSTSLCSGIIRRQFLLDNNIKFDNLRCSNDISFYYSLITKTNKIALFDEYVYHYQVNNSESLVGISGENFSDLLKSYYITKQNISTCDKYIKSKILMYRLSVILGRINAITKEQREGFKEDIIDFLMDIDWTEMEGKSNLVGESVKKFFENDLFVNALLLFLINGVIPTFKTLTELEIILQNYKYVYIYGAGKKCKDSMIWLKKNNINIENIFVSSSQDNPLEIEDIKVVEFGPDKLIKDKYETAIFITTSMWHLIPIYHKFKELGYNNVFWTYELLGGGGY